MLQSCEKDSGFELLSTRRLVYVWSPDMRTRVQRDVVQSQLQRQGHPGNQFLSFNDDHGTSRAPARRRRTTFPRLPQTPLPTSISHCRHSRNYDGQRPLRDFVSTASASALSVRGTTATAESCKGNNLGTLRRLGPIRHIRQEWWSGKFGVREGSARLSIVASRTASRSVERY